MAAFICYYRHSAFPGTVDLKYACCSVNNVMPIPPSVTISVGDRVIVQGDPERWCYVLGIGKYIENNILYL